VTFLDRLLATIDLGGAVLHPPGPPLAPRE
jgi:hypothetical protein